MKSLFTLLVLAAASALAQVSIGIQIGAPPLPRVVRVLPPRPGPEFVWIAGYWYPVGNHYKWHAGYWTRPIYPSARWIAPRYEGGRYFAGYWDGAAGRREHDHHWDRGRDRDFRERDHDRARKHDRR
jgi:WXXGXW repeat (2 copies)